MTSIDIEQAIRSHTAANGGHEKRAYLGMSQISRPEDQLLAELLTGTPTPSEADYQRLALGYETEANVLGRLASAQLIKPGGQRELRAEWSDLNGEYLFRGHTDGEWTDGSLLEIKSTVDSKLVQIEKEGKLPYAHYQQVQCYMHYGRYTQAFALYFARDTGRILVRRIVYSEKVGISLNQKARRILKAYYQTTENSPFGDVDPFN